MTGEKMTGYEIFRKIWEETEGNVKFSEHPLAKKVFREVEK